MFSLHALSSRNRDGIGSTGDALSNRFSASKICKYNLGAERTVQGSFYRLFECMANFSAVRWSAVSPRRKGGGDVATCAEILAAFFFQLCTNKVCKNAIHVSCLPVRCVNKAIPARWLPAFVFVCMVTCHTETSL